MNILIAKLGATGDVVRTTPIIRRINGQVVWLTESKNAVMLEGVAENIECFSWDERDLVPKRRYDLVINLEDTLEVASFLGKYHTQDWYGAYAAEDGNLQYTENSREWFDLSLISYYGKEEADRLKLFNRRTYQDLIFSGLGWEFEDDQYLLPQPIESSLSGDVAIAAETGPVWKMKKWAFYGELKERLEERGLTVNLLPKRPSLLEHLADVRNHRCLVSGDSLPMHLALGIGTRCVSLFSCTSPWEIHSYGLQEKIVSPLLADFFYKRDYDERAITAIGLEEVLDTVRSQLKRAESSGNQTVAR